MEDFASFAAGKKGKSNEQWLEEAQRMLASCGGRPEKEIVGEIFARALAGKRDGTLSDEQIDLFYTQVAPMLDPIRRGRLKKLVEQLKKA